jgi:hypothetical protein
VCVDEVNVEKGTPGADGLEQLTGSFFFLHSFILPFSLFIYIIAARRRRRKAVENNQKPV